MAVCVGCGLTEEDNVIEVLPRPNGGIICSDTLGLSSSLASAASQAFVSASETTTSLTYADIATVGPSVTITTGTKALVFFDAIHANVSGGVAKMSVAVSGATTIAASDDYAFNNPGTNSFNWMYGLLFDTLTAGSNIFTVKYRTTGGTSRFEKRRLVVMAL
jgi:hypothetical protein